jgi:hypothetical protein
MLSKQRNLLLTVSVIKTGGKRPLGRPRRGWENDDNNNNNMDPKMMGWEDVEPSDRGKGHVGGCCE